MKTMIVRAINRVDRYAARQMTYQMLSGLDDRTLNDIGLNRERVRRRQCYWL